MKIFLAKASNPVDGRWIELPIENDELEKILNEITCNGTFDYIIADWEDIPLKEELTYADPFVLNSITKIIQESEENKYKVMLLDQMGYKLDEIVNMYETHQWDEIEIIYLPEEGRSFEERLAYYFLDEGLLPPIDDFYIPYVNWETVGRDLTIDGYTEIEDGVAGRLP